MSASSGLGISNGLRGQRRKAAPTCKCGIPAVVYTSRTERNFNRGFFGCSYFKEKKPYCNFFKWVDEATNETMELEDWRLNILESSVAEMDHKLNYVDMKLNEVWEVKLHEPGMKINECQTKINKLSIKMVAELDKVDKEFRLVAIRVKIVLGIIVIFMMSCFLVKKLTMGGDVSNVFLLK